MRFLVLAASIAFVLGSCGNAISSKPLTDAAITDFHKRFNADDFKVVYAGSDEVLKKTTSEAEFLKFMETVHAKLGDQYSSNGTSFSVNTKNFSTTTAVVRQESEFEHGHATETFTYRVADGAVTLQGYNINSKELVLK
jgi:hypothetical protein